IPRTYQAYQRNKEELGHINYKSGTEELIREIFSGPSMFVIPMAFIVLSKKLFGEASKIQFKTLDSLSDSFGRMLKKDTSSKEKISLKEDFYKNILEEAFENHKKVTLQKPINIDENIENIVKLVSKIEKKEKTKENTSAIKQIVSDLNKAHGIHLENSQNLTLKDGLTKEAGALVIDLLNYSKDIVSKVAEHAGSDKMAHLEKLHKSKAGGRKFILASTFLATSAFLYSVPIMYKQNIQFPGIDGLVKEKNTTAKPSEKNDTKNNEVSFGRNSTTTDKFFRNFDFNGHNVPHTVLGIYTLGLMLGARLYQARNADERREVATRDFSGLSTIVFALPIFRNIISTFAKKSTGFPISKTLKTIKDHLNPTKKPFSFENITDMYSGPSKLKNKLVDFTQNIENHNGYLRKIFDFLSAEAKKALNEIADKLSDKNTTVKAQGKLQEFFSKPFKASEIDLRLPETNKEIIEMLKKAQDNNEFKPQIEILTKELDKDKNPLVKYAEAQKSIPEAISIVAISGFLGWFLPWFNINYTKNLYKKKNAVSE
ncbi:MAG: hypothetical protein WCF95_05450, partial [bacterium]